jgi:hypothetical protein
VDVVAVDVVAVTATESSWAARDVTDVAAGVDSADFTVRVLTCVVAGALAALVLDS